MKIYEYDTISEWSRKLRTRYGNRFRRYGDDDQTLREWSQHLSERMGRKFEVKKDQESTLREWSRLIGG